MEEQRTHFYIPGKWLWIGAVLVATHLSSAFYAYLRQPSRSFHEYAQQVDFPQLGFHSPLASWEDATAGSDSATNLQVAQNFAAGHGLSASSGTAAAPYEPAQVEPGAPFVLGLWLKVWGAKTAMSLFCFAVLAQLLCGAIVTATAALYIGNVWALCCTAVASGLCPPLLNHFYGISLASAEIVALIPLALMNFALARGFRLYRDADESWRRYGFWFALAGLTLGVSALIEEGLILFMLFLAVYLALGIVRYRTRIAFRRASLAGLTIAVVALGVKIPVELWRGAAAGASSTVAHGQAYWQTALWAKHDAATRYDAAGIGFGEALDPAAAQTVNAYFEHGGNLPQLVSAWNLGLAVAKHPVQAFEYKAARLPVLWLGTSRWPQVRWSLVAKWCVGFYALLGVYLVLRLAARKRIPEIVYLYALFLLCAMPVIPFEFRYTIPVWVGLMLVPGLLIEHFRASIPGRIWGGRFRSDVPAEVGRDFAGQTHEVSV
ncbi:MAG TPA: hypothetical protein VFE24_07020 [Pirellulales bacterium]|jgi:hypothetical protein|nr:hypothetical protein [Pirellulales bacterium]